MRAAGERASGAGGERGRLAEEARHERERAAALERARRALEAQVRELGGRLEEAEAGAARGGRKVVQRLEQRVSGCGCGCGCCGREHSLEREK